MQRDYLRLHTVEVRFVSASEHKISETQEILCRRGIGIDIEDDDPGIGLSRFLADLLEKSRG